MPSSLPPPTSVKLARALHTTASHGSYLLAALLRLDTQQAPEKVEADFHLPSTGGREEGGRAKIKERKMRGGGEFVESKLPSTGGEEEGGRAKIKRKKNAGGVRRE